MADATDFAVKTEILGYVWFNYQASKKLEDTFEFSDLGLPMAYMASNDMVTLNKGSDKYIEEAFELLLHHLEIDDQGFQDLDQFLEAIQDIDLEFPNEEDDEDEDE